MPDNFVQDPYSTQNFNRYGYVLNNPLMYVDQNGEFFFGIIPLVIAVVKGAAIAVAVNGINNLIQGQGFFKGAGQAALFGGVSAGIAFGVGEAASAIASSFGPNASSLAVNLTVKGFQTAAHALAGGGMSALQGGNFWHGAAGGALGSAAASAVGGSIKPGFWNAAAQVAAAAFSGGAGSAISGGDFWKGFQYGAISATVNHLEHKLQEGLSKYFKSKKEAYNFAVEESILLDMGEGYMIEREVSGFALENGDYIVLDPSDNTRHKSYNNQLPSRYKSGVLQVKYEGEWYNIRSHFHTHPSTMRYFPGRVGVSTADVKLMYNRLGGTPISILHKGNEWVVSPGDQFRVGEYTYSLKNKGAW